MNQWIAILPLLLLIAAQDILTGVFGAPSIVATMIASRAMTPYRAILLSTFAQLIGPLLFGVAVAAAVGKEVVDLAGITTLMLCAALASTVFWMVFAWYVKIPSSSTHALIGGLVGAVLAGLGPSAIHGGGLLKMLLSLTLTAPLGIIGGFVVARLCYWLARASTPKVNHAFNRGQLITAIFSVSLLAVTTLRTRWALPRWL